jgi:hypothetical protein
MVRNSSIDISEYLLNDVGNNSIGNEGLMSFMNKNFINLEELYLSISHKT